VASRARPPVPPHRVCVAPLPIALRRDHAVIDAGTGCGHRQGEFFGLAPEDFDLACAGWLAVEGILWRSGIVSRLALIRARVQGTTQFAGWTGRFTVRARQRILGDQFVVDGGGQD
jgi:hypothetical protein